MHNSPRVNTVRYRQVLKQFLVPALAAIVPVLIAMSFMNLWQWDLSTPLVYPDNNGDETWQLILTKMLVDTGWILTNPFLGAPDVAHWHNNAAAQTSAVHSIFMLGLSQLLDDPIQVQQIYFLLNFALIALTSFFSCRLLGLERISALCIGISFSLLGYRFNFIIYSFLANYFTIPLALVVIFWVITGEFSRFSLNFDKTGRIAFNGAVSSSKLFLSLLFIVMIAISDGYYAFFTLILLGFATIVRAVCGDIKNPASLLVPMLCIAILMAVALVLAWPLDDYKRSHPEEFAPNGTPDSSLIKHPFEAEVYSTSLKLLIAPATNHRIDSFADLGQKVLQTSEDARQYKNVARPVVLGIFGSFLFITALALLIVRPLPTDSIEIDLRQSTTTDERLIWAASALALFIFLCSIAGGIGTLIALVYPNVRAYDRFPLFLLFVLYVGAGAAITAALKHAQGRKRFSLIFITMLITALNLYDQLPKNIDIRNVESQDRYRSEKKFVKNIEEKLPAGAMVYQYPYSQWLSNSDYYGWGSFAHVRLYLHSAALRWSNGASKNSPVDDWHLRLSRMPIDQLLTEVQAAGFKAVVVDRRVVSPVEYQRVRNALMQRTSAAPIEDEASKLAFFSLNDPGYRLVYDKSYKDVAKLVISDRSNLFTSTLQRLINPMTLKALLEKDNDKGTLVVERAAHPKVFFTEAKFGRSDGDRPIFPLSELSSMQGTVQCTVASSASAGAASSDTLVMNITNNSDFDWQFNQGKFPLRVGVHLRSLDGALLRFDDGFRLPTGTPGYVTGKITRSEPFSIPHGTTGQLQLPLSQLNLKGFGEGKKSLIADFRMVQDGHAWFEHLGCKVAVKN